MNKNKKILFLALLGIVAIALFFFFRSRNQPNQTEKLGPVEIKEYEGEDLSSIVAFRENSIKGPQYINKEDYSLKISGLRGEDLTLTYEEIIDGNQAYEKVVTLNCVEGWSVTILWEGVLLKELIKPEQVPENAKTVIFRAHDGYSTSFPVGYIFDNPILMAYKMNGLELPPERGFPFQLVAEDKYGYKWIKWITEIEFSESEDFEGYWESRGYSNSGNLDENFFK